MYQCGLPKEMALELFKPFVIEKTCVQESHSHNVQARPKSWWNVRIARVWDVLEDVIKEHPVLLEPCPYAAQTGHPGI